MLLALLVVLPPVEAAKQPITVTASSRLTLDVASVTGVNSAAPIRGQLVDSGDSPIAGARVTVRVDGAQVFETFTAGDGRFSGTYTFTIVDRTYTVAAEFAGTTAIQGSSAQARVTAIAAGFEVADTFNATRSSPLAISGRVILNGQPANGARVTTVFDRTTLPGPLVTGTDGRFTTTFTVPATVAPGTHFLNFSATVRLNDGRLFPIEYRSVVNVRVDATLALAAPYPTEWPLGRALDTTLLLRDTAGAGVGSMPVEVRVDGPAGAVVRRAATAADGRVTVTVPLPAEEGAYNVSAYVVNVPALRGWSAQNGSFVVAPLEVAWADGVEPEVRRGTTNESLFVVLFGDERTTAWKVRAEGGDGLAVLEGDAYRVRLPAAVEDTVGLRKLRVTFTDLGSSQDLNWKVVSKPTLKLDKASVAANGQSEIVLSVTDEAGKPVRGVPLAAVLAAAGTEWKVNASGATDTNGKWTWQFTAADVPDGPLVLNATGSGLFLETSASSFELQATQVPAYWSWLPWVAAAAVLAAVGGAAYWTMRRRQAAAPPPPPEQAGAQLAAHGRSPSLAIEIDGAEPGLPAVWGAGEPFALRVRASGVVDEKESPLAGAKLALRVEGSTEFPHEITLAENGSGRVEGLQGPAGEYRVRLVYERDDRFDRTELPFTIRLVDYRKEIAREFDGVVERATLVAPRLGKQSTPRELQWTLEEKLGSSATQPLEDVASVVENANYSTHDISRADWVRLVRARQALEGHLTTGLEARAPGP